MQLLNGGRYYVSLQLFDVCLAPNTAGDGTGCDNMTAVIVQFQPTMLKRCPTDENNKNTAIVSNKRPVSPTEPDISNADSNKKFKIDTGSIEIAEDQKNKSDIECAEIKKIESNESDVLDAEIENAV